MEPEIWIVQHGEGYRLLHGHLHLCVKLAMFGVAYADVRNEGTVEIVRALDGYSVNSMGGMVPLCTDWNTSSC